MNKHGGEITVEENYREAGLCSEIAVRDEDLAAGSGCAAVGFFCGSSLPVLHNVLLAKTAAESWTLGQLAWAMPLVGCVSLLPIICGIMGCVLSKTDCCGVANNCCGLWGNSGKDRLRSSYPEGYGTIQQVVDIEIAKKKL